MSNLNLTISDIFHGDTPVLKIMKGDVKKWPSGDIAIVTFSLNHVASSIGTSRVALHDSLYVTLTPDTDYEIASVTVMMGNVDVSSTAYSNGVVSIADVTGDVVITAVAGVPTNITPTYTVTARRRVNGNGVVETNSNFSMTSPVQVFAGDVVTYVCSGYNSTSISTLALTDANHTYYTKVYDGTGQSSQSATKTRVYEVLADGYVAFSYYTNKGLTVTIRRIVVE